MKLVKRDNAFWLTLAIFGELPAGEEIERIIGTPLDSLRRKDSTRRGKIATHDVATLRLAEWFHDAKSKEIFVHVIPMLQHWLPAFRQLATDYQVSFSMVLSTFRETDQGGIEFPDDFLRILVEAKISFGVSIQARFLWVD